MKINNVKGEKSKGEGDIAKPKANGGSSMGKGSKGGGGGDKVPSRRLSVKDMINSFESKRKPPP